AAVEFRLPGHDPSDDAVRRGRRRGRTPDAERRGLGERAVEGGGGHQHKAGRHGGEQQPAPRPAAGKDLRHGHATAILLANWAPKLVEAVSELKNSSPSWRPCGTGSPARARVSLQSAGAPLSATGSLLSNEKSTKMVGS